MGDLPGAKATAVPVVLALLLAWGAGGAAAEKVTWVMQTALCAQGDGHGSYGLRVDGEAAWLGGYALCPGYTHHLDYGPLPLTVAPDGSRTFVNELAVLKLDPQGRLVSWDEYNEILGAWLHFYPA